MLVLVPIMCLLCSSNEQSSLQLMLLMLCSQVPVPKKSELVQLTATGDRSTCRLAALQPEGRRGGGVTEEIEKLGSFTMSATRRYYFYELIPVTAVFVANFIV